MSFIFPISSPQTYHPTNLTPPFRFKPSEVPLYFRKFYWYENGETKSVRTKWPIVYLLNG